MKKIILILFCWVLSLNLFANETNKFENYFNSNVEFLFLEDYRNIFSESNPERYSRIENNEYFEFVGVYELSEYDEIYENFIKVFKVEKGSVQNKVWFEMDSRKGVIKVIDDQVWIKYLKRKN